LVNATRNKPNLHTIVQYLEVSTGECGISNSGAGPRWLAKTRHESALQHWETAAADTLVRHQSYTRGEAEIPGAACPGKRTTANGVLSSMQEQM